MKAPQVPACAGMTGVGELIRSKMAPKKKLVANNSLLYLHIGNEQAGR